MSGRRKKRRLRCCAQELVDSTNVHTTPDYMEVLATKYKEKCKLESSTESESDACTINEALMNPSLPDSTKNHETVKQYLDPYDGDLESTSSESDSSRSYLQEAYTEKIKYQSHTIVAIDGKKLPMKPYKRSLLATFEPVCSYTELNSIQIEPVPTADVLLQSSSESEVLSNRVHELTFATNRFVPDTRQKEFGSSLDSRVLTESSPINSDIGGEHGFISMLALKTPGKRNPRHQNVHLGSGRILKASHESFLEEKLTSKRKLGNPIIDAGNDRMSKKKSRMIKTEG
ncbi:uncharacterized protein [Heptranchias perlo]|uniref:uncharacterized protein n=1 Tax=Heptranchias perlo TaxID=212740 RepID=UPI003559F004